MQNSEALEMVVNLPLTIDDIDSDICEISLIGRYKDNGKENVLWRRIDTESAGPEYSLTIETSHEGEKWHIDNLQKGAEILNDEQEISELFLNALLELSFQRQIDNVDGIEHEQGNAAIQVKQVDKDPYDPKLIRVDTRAFSIHQVNEMIQTGDIDLSPDFQREFVWLDNTRKSRLIESLLLRIPLPVFYLAQDENGMFKVVDGVQRLTVIRDFLNKDFRILLNGPYDLQLGDYNQITPTGVEDISIEINDHLFTYKQGNDKFSLLFSSADGLSSLPECTLFTPQFYYINAERLGPRNYQDIRNYQDTLCGYHGEYTFDVIDHFRDICFLRPSHF